MSINLLPLCDLANHGNNKIIYICTQEECKEQSRQLCTQCLTEHLHQKHSLIEYEKFNKENNQYKTNKKLTKESYDMSLLSSQIEILDLEDKQYQQGQIPQEQKSQYIDNFQQFAQIIVDDEEDNQKQNNQSQQIEQKVQRNKELHQVLIKKLQQKSIEKYKQYDNDAALDIINRTIKLDRNNIKSLEIKYDILKNKQSYFEAIKICTIALTILNNEKDNKIMAEWFVRRAFVTKYSGDKSGAEVDLQTAIKLDPTNNEYKEKLKLLYNNKRLDMENIYHKLNTYLSIFNDKNDL